jgi:uncharacterized phage protein (TIGR01671 family)
VRPIKFRAWDKKDKEMLCGVDLQYSTQGELEGIRHDDLAGDGEPESNPNWEGYGDIEDFELMQFTGLLDKNGKEIYEGDIIKNDIDRLWVIEWDKELCMFCQILYSTTGKILERMDLRFNAKEVIGNIYENPELLKE